MDSFWRMNIKESNEKFFQIYQTGDMLDLADFNKNINQLDELLQQRENKLQKKKQMERDGQDESSRTI